MSLSTQAVADYGFAVATGAADKLSHLLYNRRAQAALKVLESQQGPTPARDLERCDEYARHVLGSRRFSPWLKVYAAVAGGFREGWVPDNYYHRVVHARKNPVASKVSNLKSFTNRILCTEALPDLAYVIDGVYFSREFHPVDRRQLASLLFDRHKRVFFKPDESRQGRNIVVLGRHDLADAEAARLPDGVFQAPIRQHRFFDVLSPKATATVRVTTARGLDGSIGVRAAYLRVGREHDDIVRSADAIKIPLDPVAGTLAGTGYLPKWRRIDHHPDTGTRFAGLQVPHFDEAAFLCRTLHERCPHVPCVGWDICIEQDGGVKLMEWNADHNDIKFSEATSGPCFRGLGWENLWRREAAVH